MYIHHIYKSYIYIYTYVYIYYVYIRILEHTLSSETLGHPLLSNKSRRNSSSPTTIGVGVIMNPEDQSETNIDSNEPINLGNSI